MMSLFHKIIAVSLSFAIGAALIIGAGFYKKNIPNETVTFSVDLTDSAGNDGIKPMEFDLQDEGLPKQLIQPGHISFSTGHAAGIMNKGKKTMWVGVHVEGLKGNTALSSTSLYFDAESGKFLNGVMPGESLNLSLFLDIPRNELGNREVTSGNIIFTDYNSNRILAEIPLRIINSDYH